MSDTFRHLQTKLNAMGMVAQSCLTDFIFQVVTLDQQFFQIFTNQADLL